MQTTNVYTANFAGWTTPDFARAERPENQWGNNRSSPSSLQGTLGQKEGVQIEGETPSSRTPECRLLMVIFTNGTLGIY